MLIMSLILASLSYHWIEQPVRKGALSNRVLLKGLGGLTVACIVAGIIFYKSDGLEFRFDQEVLKYANASANRDSVEGDLLPSDDDGKIVSLLLWGDSHAECLAPVLSDICQDRSYRIHYKSKGGAPPILQTSVPRHPDLPERNDAIFEMIVEKGIDHVILASRWEAYHSEKDYTLVFNENRDLSVEETYIASLEYTVKQLQQAGCKIWIMRQVPHQKYDPSRILANAQRYYGSSKMNGISISENREKLLFSNAVLNQIAEMDGVTILDPTPFFFPRGDDSVLSAEGLSIYRDEDHVSSVGARMLRPLFEPIFDGLETGSTSSN